MHKRLLFIILLFSAFFAQDLQGQTVPVLNGGFENWTDFSYPAPDVVPPTNRFSSSNSRTYFNYKDLNVTQIPNSGGSAMRLETKVYVNPQGKDTMTGYAIWGDEPEGLGPGQPFPGGFPFTDQNVTALKLDLRYSVNANSPGMVIVQFKKNGAIVGAGNGIMSGFYILPISGTQSSFTTVTLPISPALPFAPDTCVFAITSNNPDDKSIQYPGDFVEVDNISFVGTSQKLPGGNLDTWKNYVVVQTIDNWFYEEYEFPLKTTDAKSGNFAIQLSVEERNGNPNDIQVSRILQGNVIYDQTPPYNNTYIPGTPLSGKPVSIGFYNKYTSPGIDTASVYVVLTRWDNATKTRTEVGFVYDTIRLKSSYKYKYSTITYENSLIPDSAFIQFEASKRWVNAVPGSLLKLDDVAFHYCGEILSVNGSPTVCPSATGVVFSVTDTPYSTYTWNVPAGATIVAGNGTNSIKVNFGSTAGIVSVTKTYADGCPNTTANLNVTTQAIASANAGPDLDVCSNSSAQLNGSVTGSSGGIWTGGSGTFLPNNATLNAIYNPSNAEIAAGSVTLTLTTTGNGACVSSNDQVKLTVHKAPVPNAGADQSVCANNATVSLNSKVDFATGGKWTTSGTGTFADGNSLITTYTPSVNDINNGNVVLTLTSVGQDASCVVANDQLMVSFTPAPTVNAGADITACTNNPTKTLNGIVTAPFGGVWSGGNGTFNPNTTTLNASYTPSAAEIAAGSVTLTLTSTGNGNCLVVSDQVKITYTPSPTVNAGPDLNLCGGNPVANLSGAVTVASGVIWSGGAGNFSPNTTTLNASYTPTADEMAAGSVTLTITSNGNGNCNSVNDQVVINFTPSPFVYAGSDKTICSGSTVALSGTSTTSSGTWTSSGSGTFSNVNSFNASYTPSASDRLKGSVSLTLTSANNGNCLAVSDAMVLTIQGVSTVNAGPDLTICSGTNAPLTATITNSGGVVWSTNGTGAFTPDNNSLTTSYSPSVADIMAGVIILDVGTTDNGMCPGATDQVVIHFSSSAATANAGADKSLCNGSDALLSGSVSGATGGTWTTSGSGNFDNVNSLNAIYTPSAADVTAGTVTLTLLTTGSGSCSSGSDNVVITYSSSNSVVANAGADIQICIGEVANLNGSVTGANGGEWTSSGSGSFSPDPTTLNSTYIPSSDDITAGSVSLTLTSTGNGTCNISSDVLTVSISSCTGVISFESSDLKVYPSPSTALVTIESKTGSSIKHIRLMNAMQEEVDVKVIEMSSNNAVIDLTGLNAGMYFIQVSDETKVSIKKIMKE